MPGFGGDTKKMKRVKLVVAAIAVICQHCKEPVGSPDNGSDLWEPFQVEQMRGQTANCPHVNCGKPFYLPAVIASVRMP
jgi:hypothetical protein